MCGDPSALMAFGTLLKGVGDFQEHRTKSEMARADAEGERVAAAEQAKRILMATERQRGAARAATAASGARIDEFSLANEQEIVAAGETDAAMTILGAKRRASALETNAKLHKTAGRQAVASSLFGAAHQYQGWKGTKPQSGAGAAQTFGGTSAGQIMGDY